MNLHALLSSDCKWDSVQYLFGTEAVAALAMPSVQPTSVTVTAVPAASAVPDTAKTMEVAPGGPGAMLVPTVDTPAEGVGEVAKKPEG